jgi:cytochrome c5
MSRWGNRATLAAAFLHLSHRERSDREAIRVRGYGLLRVTCPLTLTLSPQGRGNALCLWGIFATVLSLLVTLAAPAFAQSTTTSRTYNIGHVATPEQIAGWDIDVRPDGEGAPPGHGSVKEGEKVYMDKCAACHGEFGESAGRWPQLAQGKGTLASPDPVKTVGSYFPYLSSVFDYVRRAMPFGDAQSLSNDELYAVVAYVLNLNDIVDDTFVLSKETWRQVKMPNAGNFYDDDRETTEKAFWNPKPCMKDCRGPVHITSRARAVDVTPDDKAQKQGGVE